MQINAKMLCMCFPSLPEGNIGWFKRGEIRLKAVLSLSGKTKTSLFGYKNMATSSAVGFSFAPGEMLVDLL